MGPPPQRRDRGRARGEAETGGTYYRHWLAALETLVAAKGLTSAEELAACRDQWAKADHHRGFGEPIVLVHRHSRRIP